MRRGDVTKKLDAYSNQPHFQDLFSELKGGAYNVVSLGQVALDIFSGTTPLSGGSAYTSQGEGVPFIRSGELNQETVDGKATDIFLKTSVHKGTMKRSQLQNEDLLIAIVGATIGAVSIYKSQKPANINQAIAAVRLDSQKTFSAFVREYLESKVGQRVLDYLKRPVARANLNLEEIAGISIPLPPLETQRVLVGELETARSQRRDKLAQADSLLSGLDAWLLQQLGLNAPAPDKRACFAVRARDVKTGRLDVGFNSPDSKLMRASNQTFESQPFGELMLGITKGETPIGRGDNYQSEGVSFLRAQNIASGEIIGNLIKVDEKVYLRMKRSQLKGGELLYTMAGTIGIAAMFPSDLAPANINQAIAKIDLKPDLNLEYLIAIINSSVVRNQAFQTLTVSSQPNINFDQIKSLLIPLPSPEVQKTISDEVQRRRNEARRLRGEAETLWNAAKAHFESQLLGTSSTRNDDLKGGDA